jgi:autotransporter adhesin
MVPLVRRWWGDDRASSAVWPGGRHGQRKRSRRLAVIEARRPHSPRPVMPASISSSRPKAVRLAFAALASALLVTGIASPASGFVCAGSPNGSEPQSGLGATAGTGIDGVPNVACGQNANAAGQASTNLAVGSGANAFGFDSANIALGGQSYAGILAPVNAAGFASVNIAIGNGANASGNTSSPTAFTRNIAIGLNADAHGDGTHNLAFGTNLTASGNAYAFGADQTASGSNSVAVGSSNLVTGNNSGAFGTGQTVNGNGSFAIGDPNTVNGNGSFVYGDGNTINGTNQGGWGDGINVVGSNNTVAATASAAGTSVFGSGNAVNATNALVMANTATVTGASAIAIGNTVSVSGANAVAIGSNTSANFDNSVAIGNGATVTRANQQMFGTAANTYTMPGITSAASRAAQSGPTQVVTSDAGGNLATSTLSGLGIASTTDLAAINAQLAAQQNQINVNQREARAGTALALAASGLHYDTRPGKASVAAAFGNFKGQSGLAVGLGYALNQTLRVNAAFTGTPQVNDYGVVVGASWTLN